MSLVGIPGHITPEHKVTTAYLIRVARVPNLPAFGGTDKRVRLYTKLEPAHTGKCGCAYEFGSVAL